MSTSWEWAKENPDAAARTIRELQRENAALRSELQQILGLLSDMEIVTKTHLQALRDADLIKRIEDTIERVDAAEEAAKQSA